MVVDLDRAIGLTPDQLDTPAPLVNLDAMEHNIVSQLEADQAWALEQPFPTVEQATDHVMIPLEEC